MYAVHTVMRKMCEHHHDRSRVLVLPLWMVSPKSHERAPADPHEIEATHDDPEEDVGNEVTRWKSLRNLKYVRM